MGVTKYVQRLRELCQNGAPFTEKISEQLGKIYSKHPRLISKPESVLEDPAWIAIAYSQLEVLKELLKIHMIPVTYRYPTKVSFFPLKNGKEIPLEVLIYHNIFDFALKVHRAFNSDQQYEPSARVVEWLCEVLPVHPSDNHELGKYIVDFMSVEQFSRYKLRNTKCNTETLTICFTTNMREDLVRYIGTTTEDSLVIDHLHKYITSQDVLKHVIEDLPATKHLMHAKSLVKNWDHQTWKLNAAGTPEAPMFIKQVMVAAVIAGNYEVFSYVDREIEYHPVITNDGNTLLHLACKNARWKIAMYILSCVHDINPFETNNNGQTAFDVAAEDICQYDVLVRRLTKIDHFGPQAPHVLARAQSQPVLSTSLTSRTSLTSLTSHKIPEHHSGYEEDVFDNGSCDETNTVRFEEGLLENGPEFSSTNDE